MNRKQKHTNLPMIVMKQSQHGGWYEYGKYYIDMDVPDPLLFVEFYQSGRKNLSSTAQRMDFVHRAADRKRYVALRQPGWPACSRRLSPFLSPCPLEHGSTVDDAVADIDQNILSNANHNLGLGRHLVSPQRQKGRGGWMVA